MQITSCLHPVTIRNPWTHQVQTVACGHCPACLLGKGYRWQDRIQREMAVKPYVAFLTLTYSPQCVPTFYINDSVHMTDRDKNGVLYPFELDSADMEDLDWKEDEYHDQPYIAILSHHDLSIFIRNLFKQFDYANKKRPSYFGIGEYGSRNRRPHAHFAIFSDESFYGEWFEKAVNDSWSMSPQFDNGCNRVRGRYDEQLGITNIQYVTRGTPAAYLASYLNCHTDLPSFYHSRRLRQFHTQSRTALGSCYVPTESLNEAFDTANPKVSYLSPRNFERIDERLPSFNSSALFPRCSGYDIAFDSIDDAQLCQCAAVSSVYECRNDFYRVMRSLPSDETPYLRLLSCVVASSSNEGSLASFTDDQLRARCDRLWRWSRRCRRIARARSISLMSYVERWRSYWCRAQLARLKEFYEFQSELVDKQRLDPRFLCALYVLDRPSLMRSAFGLTMKQIAYYHDYNKIPSYVAYKLQTMQLFLNNSKTKKRNSETSTRGSF